MATLSQQDLKILEQTRQRLFQLTNSILSLQQNIVQSDPLPPWSAAILFVLIDPYIYACDLLISSQGHPSSPSPP